MTESKNITTIYAVDDEPFTVHVWLQFEKDQIFRGVAYDGSDDVADAIRHAQSSQRPAVYVLDARVCPSPETFDEMRRLLLRNMSWDINSYRKVYVLMGVFAGACLKAICPESQIVILSAFVKEMSAFASDDKFVGNVLDRACDHMLPKPCQESDVIDTVRACLTAIQVQEGRAK